MERQAQDGTYYKMVGPDQWEVVTREAQDGTVYKKVGADAWETLDRGQVEDPESQEESFLSRLGSGAIDSVVSAGQFLDSYTGAPTRQAISEAQQGRNPLTGFADQFGEDPSLAPTGQDIARRAGVPATSLNEGRTSYTSPKTGITVPITEDSAPNLQEIVGVGVDVLADPTMLIPGRAIAKGVSLGAGGIKQGLGLARKMPGSKLATKALTKLGSELTGISPQSIRTYIDKHDEVESVIKKYGDDVTEYADEIRRNVKSSIGSTIGALSEEINQAIKNSPKGSYISNDKVIGDLERLKSKLNPELWGDEIVEIGGLQNKVYKASKFGDESWDTADAALKAKGQSLEDVFARLGIKESDMPKRGFLDAKTANEVKRYLQKSGKSSYQKGGQMFIPGAESQKAAKSGARQARKAEVELAPGTARPNLELSKLHQLDKLISKNLIKEGATERALLAAGAGSNQRSISNLKKIMKITGFDALSEAEKLASVRSFGAPDWLPVDTTGKSLTRMAVAGTLGSIAGLPGVAVMLSFTSPKVLKKAIQGGVISKKLINGLLGKAGGITDKVLNEAVRIARTSKGQKYLKLGMATSRVLSMDRGEDKFAKKGLEKIKSEMGARKYSDLEYTDDKSIRNLLIQASMVKVGSKAFLTIIKKLDNKVGEK